MILRDDGNVNARSDALEIIEHPLIVRRRFAMGRHHHGAGAE